MPDKPSRDRITGALSAQRRRFYGVRLERFISLIIIGFLIGLIVNRVSLLMVQVERTNVTQIQGEIRAALGVKVALYVARGDTQALAALAGSNPMALLESTPTDYLGALANPDPNEIEPGHWYFNVSNGRLIYRVKHVAAFNSALAPPPHAAFAIRLRYRDRNRNGRYDSGDALYGVVFKPVASFHWNNETEDTP